MASPIPQALKPAAPFITRGRQLEKAEPVISYFCQLWGLQIILDNKLHKADSESTQFTTQLLGQVEHKKASLGENDALKDDVVGQAYVEAFANKIFSNADNAQRARRCTSQTAETFLAASVFLELPRVFNEGQLDQEALSKIRFAKFHAARILRAVKAGEDPNLPATPEEEKLQEDAAENELQQTAISPTMPPRPSVEDAVDESQGFESRMARTSITDESLHPSRGVSPLPSQQQHHYQPQPPPHHTPQDQRLPYQHTVPSPPSAHRSPELNPYFPPARPDYLGGSPSGSSLGGPSLGLGGPSLPPRPSSGAFDLPSAPPSAAPSSSSFNLPSAPTGPAHSSAFDLPSSPPGLPHSSAFNLPNTPGGLDFPSSPSSRPPPPSGGGLNFPSSPTNAPHSGGLNLPSAPTGPAGGGGAFDLPSVPGAPSNTQPDDFYTSMTSAAPPPQPPPMGALPDEGPPRTAYSMPPNTHHHPIPHRNPAPPPAQPPPPPQQYPQQSQQQSQQGYGRYGGGGGVPAPAGPPPADNFIDPEDSEALAKAQKHAKFAISALNYDDIPTAVKELRNALRTLGART